MSESKYQGRRAIKVARKVGSGGRVRQVAICEMGCWHGSWGQAMKCKNALRALASGDPYAITPEAREELAK